MQRLLRMSFSIPITIHPVYSVLALDSFPLLEVGTAIKDLPEGTETAMKKAHKLAIDEFREKFKIDTLRAEEQYKADKLQFDSDFQAAKKRASEAEQVIDKVRHKQVWAITFLAISVVAAAGAIISAAVTHTWPILFVAAPFLIGIAPISYYVHIFRKKISSLEREINFPNQMHSPSLQLPPYHPPTYSPDQDLDLSQARLKAQHALASLSQLKQLAHSDYTHDQVVSYALLDKVTQMSSEKRPRFYATCLQLIISQKKIDDELSQYNTAANEEYNKLMEEARLWKSQQDTHLAQQESALHQQEQDLHRRRMHHMQYNEERSRLGRRPVLMNGPNDFQIEHEREKVRQQRNEVAHTVTNRSTELTGWLRTTQVAIASNYQIANRSLEETFFQAKAIARVP